MTREKAITFALGGDRLLGIVHEPETTARAGVLIIVGGPQYRVGAHRQFVHLARRLAENGVAAMRFDYRGIGDSEGAFQGFEHIADDIDAAVAAFREAVPSLESIILWGLCDAASAIAMKADHAPDVQGCVLLNPWVRTDEGAAKAFLKHYYLQRLMSGDFWKKLLSGKVKAGESMKGLGSNISVARQSTGGSLPVRVTRGVAALPVPALLILSGQDLTAREFEDAAGNMVTAPPAKLSIARLEGSDHTFSKSSSKEEVAALTLAFTRQVSPGE